MAVTTPQRTPNPLSPLINPNGTPNQIFIDFLRGMSVDPSYTVAGLLLIKPEAGLRVYVTDATGGACPAYGDGEVFRRTSDNTVVS